MGPTRVCVLLGSFAVSPWAAAFSFVGRDRSGFHTDPAAVRGVYRAVGGKCGTPDLVSAVTGPHGPSTVVSSLSFGS